MLSIGIPRLEGRLDERFATIIARIERYLPNLDRATIERAYQFASEMHEGQFRRSGEPYIIHPLEVAHVLADLEVDEATVAAALLHDTIEDGMLERENGEVTQLTAADLAERFGPEIASLVDGVTKLGAIHFHSHEARQAENLRKLLLATAQDLRVVLIKLADRFHNMRTLKFMGEEDQKRIADETLHIFAPIAHRLGVWKIKWELEDLAFRALEPQKYREIQVRVNRTRAEREKIISTAIQQLQDSLQNLGITSEVVGRPKHFYSIYNKMKNQSLNFEEILDLEAIRVIVNSEKECYEVLGQVHRMWMPLQNMFTDYIARPKMNNYQSLHTKVIGPSGQLLEVQIRTKEMHRVAEVGIAAHWNYKEGGSSDVETDQKMAWIRGLLELQTESKNDVDWLESIKLDLFKDQVFVFTPAGDIIDLPAGSTPIDFAFRIHTDVGTRCAGAKVNGILVPLSYTFVNGDVAEIIVSARQKPSLDWLKLVASHQARSKIKAYFRKIGRDENIRLGRQALEEECKREGLSFNDVQKSEKFLALITKHNLTALDDLYALIGYGELTVEGVIHRIREDIPRRTALELQSINQDNEEQPLLPTLTTTDGIDNIRYIISKCCHPIPGDSIIGYITRGKGVAIHRMDCPNLRVMMQTPEEKERLMVLDWREEGNGTHQAELEITAADRVGLFADITAILTDMKTNIRSAKLTCDVKKHTATILVKIDISGVTQLSEIIARLNRVTDVLGIHRRNTKKK